MQRQEGWAAAWPPISLTSSAALLRQEGFKVNLKDCIVEGIDFSALKQLLRDFSPDLLVLNTATFTIEGDLSIACIAKEISPRIKVAAMGIHVTSLPDDSFKMSKELDFIIRGEPEYTIRDIASAIRDGKSYNEIPGISININGKINHNVDRPPIENLDLLPFPAWDLVDLDKYQIPISGERFLLIAPGRGCPYQCSFCASKAYYGTKLRLRKPERVVDEIEWNLEKFGVSNFLFWMESFTIDRDYVLQLTRQIVSRGLKVKWICNSRVDDVDKELLMALKEAGCWMIAFGVESGNQEILDTMKKNTSIEQTVNAVKQAKESGLKVAGHCIIGAPGDTPQTITDTIKFVRKLDLDYVQYYCCVPFPGSDLYEIARSRGWINTLRWDRFEQSYSVLEMEGIDSRTIMALRRKAFWSFYLTPKIILRTLKEIRSIEHMKRFMRIARDFFSWIKR